MRIDLVFPRFKLLSGAERAILGLAGALAEAGHRPRIVCHQFHGSCRPRLVDGIELVTSGARLDWSRNRYLNAAADYARTLGLGRLLDAEADFRVFFGPALLLAWRRLSASRHAGIPSLYYCWEPPRVLFQDRDEVLDRLGWARWPMAAALAAYRRLDRRMVAAMDAVVTSSPFAAARIEECYGRAAEVITLGIDRERLDGARPVAGASAAAPADQKRGSSPTGGASAARGRPRLLTVNYLHPRKRIDLIIEATALLGAAAPMLTVVGDGPERQRLQQLAAALGIADRVTFAGFVDDDELPARYWQADCYLHATRDESFGLSVLEASYCMCPVVAVDEGGVRDTVDEGVTGYRVAATPAAIAAGVERVLGAPDRGAALGEAGRARIQARFRWDRGAGELVEVARGVEKRWSGAR
jgi:glycosyltransferase involved in cell wall biosynthesis